MRNVALRLLGCTFITGVRIAAACLLVLVLTCFFSSHALAAVTVTAASGGSSICSNRAVGGSAAAFTTLGTITITEGVNSDFNGAPGGITNTIILAAPSGWQFSTVTPSFSFITGSNVTAVSGSITSTTLTINITANNTHGSDQVFINGLQVQATGASSAAGNITASFVSGVAGVTTGAGGTNFGSLSLTSPVTPTISIAASPGGAICPGTAVTFTPTITNGGATPSYQWALNGVNVSSGPTYTNSSLAAGNTVTCTLTTSVACYTSLTAASNVVTMTVNAAPAAISGTATACVGFSTSLSSATSSGTWSSSATGVATVSSSGVVTGVSAGTTVVSYTAGGCSATRMVVINLPPSAPSLTPATATVCNGSTVAIEATGTIPSTTVLSQTFNSGISPWTVDNTGSIATLPGSEWKACHNGYINQLGIYFSPDNTTFAMTNGDTSGSSSWTSTQLISPAFSLVGYAGATLSFQHAYEAWTGDLIVRVDISTDGGGSWTPLRSYIGTNIGTKTSFVNESVSLNAYLGQPNLKIRYYYYCHWGYYWAVENIAITGIPAIVAPTWSPVTHLFTNSAATIPYTAGTQVSTVYLKSLSITTPTPITYTATSTTGSCFASSTSAVTINPTPAAITGIANLCVSSTTTLANSSTGGTWVSSNTSVATVGSATGIVSGVTVGTATISYVSGMGCAATLVVTVNTAPGAISGSLAVCQGANTSLSSATAGGTWSSSNSSIIGIGSASGIASGVALGTATITYSLGAGCTVTGIATVAAMPASVTGPSVVCVSRSITLSNATPGGTWASPSAEVTVATTTGVVTGAAAGTAIISYIVPTGEGCVATRSVTVNAQAPITGPASVCSAGTVTLANSIAGGTWSSTATSVASVSGSGVVSGTIAGTSVISYTLPTGCAATVVFTVHPLPAAITGSSAVCEAASTTLSNTVTGGSWASSNTMLATVGSGSGVLTGIAEGTVTISYILPTTCFITRPVTVHPVPAAITGTLTVCSGTTTALSSATTGGTWASASSSVALIGSATGIVTGNTAGTTTLSYILPTGCSAVETVTVNSLPAPIASPSSVCTGSSITCTDATAGGVWSTSNSSIAATGAASGIVTGGVAGTANITYTLPTGCLATKTITVNPLPAAITGSSSVCIDAATTLSSLTPGGTWSSAGGFLTVFSSTGAVIGAAAGSPVVTYTLPTGCYVTHPLTVNPLPPSVSGTLNTCVGLNSTLVNSSPGGTWSSSNTTIATVTPASGIVSGVSPGTTLISYTLPTGCVTSSVFTVNALPSTISGPSAICLVTNTTYTNATAGGSWSGSSSAVITVGAATGVVTAVGTGTAILTYSLGTGCITTLPVTVNPLPAAISGASTVCTGMSTVFSDATSGGTWSSSNTAIATVGMASGVVTGASAGTASISYTIPTGCFAVRTITVNASPAAIMGTAVICAGSNTTLTNATPGGTWSSTNTTVAPIGISTGIITGGAAGSSVIFYTLSSGCSASRPVTVNTLPGIITGASVGCVGIASTLSNSVAGGTWASSNVSIATVGSSSGVLTGIAVGTTVITYTLASGCARTLTMSVNIAPGAISGSPSMCLGAATILTNSTGGGTWSSSNSTVASIGSSSGFIVAYSMGTATISYTLSNGCAAVLPLTVNPNPAAISGTTTLCQGQTTSLANATAGGSWSSTNSTIASVDASTGIVTGVGVGTCGILYTLPTGCFASRTVTVNAAPSAITGSTSVCQGSTSPLSNAVSGGAWSSSNTSVATVSTSGIVSGMAVGTAVITYATTGCFVTATVTVNLSPSAIIGASAVCQGRTTTLTSTTPGGSWSTSNAAIAAVSADGVVSGVSMGTATIFYGVALGCSVSRVVTVNAVPAAISGVSSICPGGLLTLSNATPGGTWTSSNTTVAIIGASTGILGAGATSGTTTISYTLSNGCAATAAIVVNTVSPITGATSVCVGSSVSLDNASTGGTWSSSNISVASVSSAGGVASGVSFGTATITYALSAACRATRSITVHALPAAITGSAAVCPGTATTLASTTTGGTWSSSIPAAATIGSATGIVSGVAAGTSLISYTAPTGCRVFREVTIHPLPPAITGPADACLGVATTLANAVSGGTWSSANASVATVSTATGIVTGASLSTTHISYTLPTGCFTSIAVTVHALPAAISGGLAVCQGDATTLSSATAGGSWGVSSPAAAIISAGVLTGLAPGTVTVTYTAVTGCYVTAVVTVNTLATAITGTLSVCEGFTTTLSNATTGGSWSGSSATVATIDAATGAVTAIAPGIATITYTPAAGCITTATLTVHPTPAAITGAAAVCKLSTAPYATATAGGTWSSSLSSVLTIDAVSGLATGVTAGTATLTYTSSVGCYTARPVTVNPLPESITGSANICTGFTTALTTATPGGTWSSATPSVGTVSSTGAVAGITGGTTTISYTLPTGCAATRIVTVNTLSPVTGPGTMCTGSSVTLANATGPGTWSTGSPAIASVGATSGIVTGIAAGTAVITFTYFSGCYATSTVTVHLTPPAITGPSAVCAGSVITLTNAAAGGTWSTSAAGVATADAASGLVTGIAAGTANIVYTLSAGCSSALTITVHPLPLPVTGSPSICAGLTTVLSSATPGGVWSSISPSVATVGAASGAVTGAGVGTALISYTIPTGCAATAVVTVHPLTPVTGATGVCIGSTTLLSNATPGGTWSVGSTGALSVDAATGLVTGLAAGTATVSYHYGTGCYATAVVTVHPLPGAITGGLAVCTGSTSSLSATPAGGTWVATSPAILSVATATGVVSGTAEGTALVTYTLPTGCAATAAVTVHPLPAPITGVTSVCNGSTTTLSTTTTAVATWASGNVFVAAVSSSGVVTGFTAGTATISCFNFHSCAVTTTITVNPLPDPITGTALVCEGGSTTLSNTTAGGTWSAAASPVAVVAPVTGVVSGMVAGTLPVTYTLPTGCIATIDVTVQPTPATISGLGQVCVSSAITLSSGTTGGVWVSGNPAIATADAATGAITGVSAGTVAISYVLPAGCYTVRVITVNPLPAVITGSPGICHGLTATLSSATPSGSWTTGAPAIASVSASGVVTALSPGTASIVYALPTGCYRSATVTVHPLPAAIAGPAVLCAGLSATMSSATPGGTWSSASAAVASIASATGIITGINAGNTIITYTSAAGCITSTAITVNTAPSGIAGALSSCAGTSATLASATAGGTWASGSTTVATVTASGGVVSALAAGTATISYTLSNGCRATAVFTVSPLPPAISGSSTVCLGSSTLMSNGAAGGTWSTSGAAVSIGSTSGIMTGLSADLGIITYTLPTGCRTVSMVSVHALPAVITGASSVCLGLAAAVANTTAGGTWSSSNPAIAAITSSGSITGLAPGTANISYTVATGCSATRIFTVHPVLPVGGSLTVCAGTATALTNGIAGGTWSSASSAVAEVAATTGFVVGIAPGTAAITYSLPTGCTSSAIVTVQPTPAAVTGATSVCQGRTTTLSSATAGGTWSSGSTSVVVVGLASGIVTGVAPDTAVIFYMLPTGCNTSVIVTVNPLMPITGATVACVGAATTLANGVAGGTWSSSTPGVATVGSSTGAYIAHGSGTAIISYMLPTGCLATTTITVNALPVLYNVTGGGTYCSGGSGLPVGLDGSASGMTYSLYRETDLIAVLPGTGGALSFGLQTVAGTYKVIAASSVTSCSRLMSGTAAITVGSYVTPSVSLTTGMTDTACTGALTTITAFPVNGGSSPLFAWRLNGSPLAATGGSYTYIPAPGDVVTCRITSSAACLTVDTAAGSLILTVLPVVTPAVAASVSPGASVCELTPVTFTAAGIFGGTAPAYTWYKNGSVAASGPVYTYTPADGDEVRCMLASNAVCRTVDVVYSPVTVTTVTPYAVPSVTVTATPGLSFATGEEVTFTAAVTNAGSAPSYQWLINGTAVSGATSPSYTSSSLAHDDSVSCLVTSSGPCGGITGTAVVVVQVSPVGVTGITRQFNLQLIPNPTSGTFTVTGFVTHTAGNSLSLTVTDVLGRDVYMQELPVVQDRVTEQVTLPPSLPGGTYVVRLAAADFQAVYHLVVAR